jgi:two-component system sensor histidine kinase MtrB
MSPRAGILHAQSLRLRITAAFVAAGILLAGTLSAATFFAVREFLEDQRIRQATDDTITALQLARDYFRGAEAETDQFVAQLQLRGSFEAVVTDASDFFPSNISLTPEVIPDALSGLAADERLGYLFSTVGGARNLIFGGPLPPVGTDVFLFFSLADLDETMSVLLRVLVVAGVVIIIISAVIAQRVAAGIVRPVAEISGAAQRVAEGLLETRVPAGTRDEVGVLAASFNQMAAAFQDMLDRERRFVANVSHELRTPLSTLGTASEMLASHREEFPERTREAVDLIAEDVSNLQRLIRELMEVSEVDAGRAVLRLEEVDLLALTHAIVAKSRRDAPVSGRPVAIRADKARVERIVSNLVDNAFEHGRGVQVHVRVARDATKASVEVSDRGPGISPADLPHLFDRFYKTDGSRSRDRGGVGLGLAIAQENARLMGGIIEASSTGGLTTFTLRLPIAEAQS